MNKVDIQFGTPGFDVLVNGDHYLTYHSHAEAVQGARQAADEGRSAPVIIRDFTKPGEGRTISGVRFTEIEPMLPRWEGNRP